MFDAGHIVERFRAHLLERRQKHVETLVRRLQEREYVTVCGRIMELDELNEALQDFIRQANSLEGDDDGSASRTGTVG